jgi:hypothetical protein
MVALPEKTGGVSNSSTRELLWSFWAFFVHIAVGTFLFALISLTALALGSFVKWLGESGMPPAFLLVATALQYALFALDIILYLLFLLSITTAQFRELAKALRKIKEERL